MTAAINDFVKEWSQLFKPNKCKNFNLETTKLCKKKKNNITSLKPALLPTLLSNETQILIHSSTGGFSIFLSATFRKPLHQDSYQGYYRQRLNMLYSRQVLAEQAHYPCLTHLTLSSSDEQLLSSSTASIIS